MTPFTINKDVLKKLFEINQFTIPTDAELVFVGIRGCLPQDTGDNNFKGAQLLNIRDVDHRNLRCTLVQWKKSTDEIAVFAGSTVPSIDNILGFKKNPPRKSNCLTPGFYKNYVKGKHRPSNTKNSHDAFRQNGQPLAIRRTFDNTFYDNFDTIEVSTGCDDNMHAAWTLDVDSDHFSSAGCQVVMGIPFCEKTKNQQNDNKGPWKIFKDNGYASAQDLFPYALFTSAEVFKVASNPGAQISIRIKFGSTGDLVKQVQNVLIGSNFLSGTADGDFGTNTFNAIKKFQIDNFGVAATDCIVGPVTSQALGITFPLITV
jgi:Putative peptidoglycan binding domain